MNKKQAAQMIVAGIVIGLAALWCGAWGVSLYTAGDWREIPTVVTAWCFAAIGYVMVAVGLGILAFWKD